MILGGLCIAQLGGQEDGVIVAYNLTTGEETWRSPGEGTAYASPVLLAAAETQSIIAQTDKSVVSIDSANGTILWQTPFVPPRRGYNAATPIIDGSMIIYSGSGRGTTAVQLEKQGPEWKAKELWSNETSVQYNSPILKDGLVYGISDGDALFCLNAETGETVWTTPLARGRGYGSVVDAGSVLLALTPSSELLIFEPNNQEFKEIARYKVSDSDTYAYPVLAGSRIYVKDQDSVALWMVE
jgi:outer membrane protein assembly factor BamB